MGLRLRLKSSFSLAGFTGPSLAILKAMKTYGIILADNGSNWYFSGESHQGWAPHMDALLASFSKVHGGDFEPVDSGPISTAGL